MAIKVLGLLSHASVINGETLYHGVDYARIINPLVYLDKKKVEVLRAKLEVAEKSPILESFSMDDLIAELDKERSL